MTYEDALDWLERNVNMYDYDNFRDYYEACEENIQTPSLFDKPEFNNMLEDLWLNEFGNLDREDVDIEPSYIPGGQRELDIPVGDTRIVNQTNISKHEAPVFIYSKSPITIRKLPEEYRQLPSTGEAPRVIPAIIIPGSIPVKQKVSILQRFRNLFRRKK